jgi:uncharacterized membrane protein
MPHRALMLTLLVAVAACDSAVPPTAVSPHGSALTDARALATIIPKAPYTIQDLGTPPGFAGSFALENNDRGDIVAQAFTNAPNSQRSFLYTTGWHDLGALPGTSNVQAQSINNLNHIVGWSSVFANGQDVSDRPFIWTHEHGMQARRTLPGTDFTQAYAISDLDEIVGCVFPVQNGIHLVRWLNPEQLPQDLGAGPPGAFGVCPVSGAGINFSGQIGIDILNFTGNQAGLYNGRFHAIPLPPGRSSSQVAGINFEGVVAGVAGNPTGGVSFLWDLERGLRLIPFLPGDATSSPSGINFWSVVAGNSSVSPTATCNHPWIWAPFVKTPALLPLLTGFHPEADCTVGFAAPNNLNDFGVVVGFGLTAQNEQHTLRWVPDERDPEAQHYLGATK